MTIPPANSHFEDSLPAQWSPPRQTAAIDLQRAPALRRQTVAVDLQRLPAPANLKWTPPAINTIDLADPPTTLMPRDIFRALLPGTIVGDYYEIDARLGAGAMGEVYAARHIRLGKRVAIKVIRQRLSEDVAAIRRFTTESQILAQIQHPAIVTVEHVGELPDSRAYFVMEYLRGESLAERLSRGRVPLREALRILYQMARGLEAAHDRGVIHRDLKPDNTFLVSHPHEAPTVKLLDFGLAKLADDLDAPSDPPGASLLNQHAARSSGASPLNQHAERSMSGIAIGTPLYMSPEQARGPDVDQRTDIYALGCVAYELILGVRPFPHARTAPEIYAAHLHAVPPLPRSIWPEIPPQLDLMLFAMLAKEPAHRPTLAQVRSVITSLRTDTPSQQAATTLLVGPPASWTRLRNVAIIIIAFGILTVGATLGAALAITIKERLAASPVHVIPRHSTPLSSSHL